VEEGFNSISGIWQKDLKSKSKLPTAQINKILKVLEGKKLVKNVPSLAVLID
jgi:hypothetical protein